MARFLALHRPGRSLVPGANPWAAAEELRGPGTYGYTRLSTVGRGAVPF